MASEDPEQVELEAVIREVQERVRARYPVHTAGSVPIVLPDLMPVVHARDRAEGKVAAIGSVNPRPPGWVNDAIQAVKRRISRLLGWFVRDQIDFNRAVMDCVQALLEAMNESRRSLSALAALVDQRHAELRTEVERLDRLLKTTQSAQENLQHEAQQLKDVRAHWAEWRKEWERKLSINEVQFLRSVADLQSAFQHRVTLMESNFRDLASGYHKDFTAALDRARLDIQQRLWSDLEKIRIEYEKLIHTELRVARQRMLAQASPVRATTAPAADASLDASADAAPKIDALRFSERFRGPEEEVRQRLQRYVSQFEGARRVVDLGCGRGEFLECLQAAGIPACGVEKNEELVRLCRAKGLSVDHGDIFSYLAQLPAGSVDGIFCAQLVEHLSFAQITELVERSAQALPPGGKLVMETPNPGCLAIFASHFYLDPTHLRPVPPQLLAFLFEEHGFGQIAVEYVNFASESWPEVTQLPEDFRQTFFGALDYAISGRRL
ncbi:MAG: methyltransferase domain-containing protein [Bryobacteraceae bacterium]|nr:methyltransferase domain-containing protein [Bryobacteraceae bacterium]MDW8378011.1 methyltransferase domain-containing protein [Bryobacterales bacterium]